MSNPTIERLQEQRHEQEEFVSHLLESVESEQRALVDTEIKNIEAAKERISALDAQLAPLMDWEEQRAAARQMVVRKTHSDRNTVAAVDNNEPLVSGLEGRSLGEVFVNSDEFQNRQGGRTREASFPLTMAQVRAPGLLTTSTSPGSAFIPLSQKISVPNGAPSFRLYDVVDHIQVGVPSIDFVVWGTREGAKTPTTVAEGAKKPEVELKATSVHVVLEKTAGYVKVTQELLEDGAAYGIRQFIDGELVRGIMTKLEADIVASIGTAAVPAVTGASKQPLEEVLRMAAATVEMAGFPATAVAVNPIDAAKIDIAATKLGGVTGFGSNVNPWGLRVIPVPGLTAGTAYVGDFMAAVKLLERTNITVSITDSDADDFVHNIYTVVGEVRAKAVVSQPLALAKTVLTP